MTETPQQPLASGLGWGPDLRAGVAVALLALPLSLGIASASGFPALSGIVTVGVGGLVTLLGAWRGFVIKGPAAGLISVLLGAVAALDVVTGGRGLSVTLAAVVIAGLLQIAASRADVARWVSMVPRAVVAGMLAAIGVAIVRTQISVMIGGAEAPLAALRWSTGDAVIGLVTLAVALGWPQLVALADRRRPGLARRGLARAPGAVVGVVFGLGVALTLTWGPAAPVCFATLSLDPAGWGGLPRPDFSGLAYLETWRWVLSLAAIGTLESTLTAKVALDLGERDDRGGDGLRPERDLLGVGVGNVIAPLFGGVPMISEVVRTCANHDQGALTRRSALLHAALVVAAVALVPTLLSMLPRSALAAVIVAAGLQLMAPRRWWDLRHRGVDILAFGTTLAVSVAVDLLFGVALGLALHLGAQRWARSVHPTD